MLVFTFDYDFDSKQYKEDLEAHLKERFGEDCVALPFCTGVYQIEKTSELRKDVHNQVNDIPKVLNEQAENKSNDRD